MLINKLNLASLCVAFCFLGCGEEKNIKKSQFDNLLSQINTQKKKYDNSSDTLEIFHENTNLAFNLKLASIKDEANKSFPYGNQTQKEQSNRENETRKIDKIQSYAEAASIEVGKIPQGAKFTFPTDVYAYLTKDIYNDSNPETLNDKVFTDTLVFTLTTKIIDLMVLFPNRFDILINNLYDAYNKVFLQITGLNINFKDMCDKSGLTVYISQETYKTFKILTGLPIVVIENYALWGRKVSSNDPATLQKIFHDNYGSSKVLLNKQDGAYLAFLNAINVKLQKALAIIQEHLLPLVVIPNTFDMTKSEATIKALKDLVDNEKKFPVYSKSFKQNGEKLALNKGGDILPNGDGTVDISPNILNNKEMKLFQPFIRKDCIQILKDVTDKVNNDTRKIREKELRNTGTESTKTAFDLEIKPVKL